VIRVVYSFFVSGLPKAQPRPRTTKTGHVYNPDTAKEWKEVIMTSILGHRKPRIDEPVFLTVSFFFPLPKRLQKADVGHLIPHTVKPDSDNLLKAVMDAFTDAGAWKDDALVFAHAVDKWYTRDKVGARIIVKAGFHS
jgi:Holliday junction resolvase RusA-like endonuclease